jgi:tetratricopeptide (TPR) repeat protein
MKTRFIILAICLSLICAAPSWARPADFIEVYTYQAGETDSKLSCRTVSLIEVKRLLLEKIGTYLEARTEVKNFQIASDEIVALTAGIVKTEIIKEEWTGGTYRLTARIEADPDEIAGKIDEMRKDRESTQPARRLAQINETTLERMRRMQEEMERIQSNLVQVNQDLAANTGLLMAWDHLEEGVNLRQSGRAREAVAVISDALAENPSAMGYHERGQAHLELGRYVKAVEDFSEALKREPNRRGSLFGRGIAYWKLGRKEAAVTDMRKAAGLGQGQAKKWLKKHRYAL